MKGITNHTNFGIGMTRLFHLDTASAEIARITDWTDYGIDEEAPFPEFDTSNNAEIPESRVALCDFHIEELSGTISPLVQDGNEGIYLYIDTLRIIENAIEIACHNIT